MQVLIQFTLGFGHEEIEANEVREAHGEYHGVGETDHTLEAHGGSDHDAETKEQFEEQIHFTPPPEDIGPRLLAVVGPSNHGGEGEENDGQG